MKNATHVERLKQRCLGKESKDIAIGQSISARRNAMTATTTSILKNHKYIKKPKGGKMKPDLKNYGVWEGIEGEPGYEVPAIPYMKFDLNEVSESFCDTCKMYKNKEACPMRKINVLCNARELYYLAVQNTIEKNKFKDKFVVFAESEEKNKLKDKLTSMACLSRVRMNNAD